MRSRREALIAIGAAIAAALTRPSSGRAVAAAAVRTSSGRTTVGGVTCWEEPTAPPARDRARRSLVCDWADRHFVYSAVMGGYDPDLDAWRDPASHPGRPDLLAAEIACAGIPGKGGNAWARLTVTYSRLPYDGDRRIWWVTEPGHARRKGER